MSLFEQIANLNKPTMNEELLSKAFTCEALELFIKDTEVTIEGRQYAISENQKQGVLTSDEEELLGLWEYNQTKEQELNYFVQKLVFLKNAWAIRKNFETMQSN